MTAELRERLQTTLGASLTLERELGGGGMSRVFVARDQTLGRRVVVKVLSPELAAGVNADRFRREIQLAARLQHPHIVPLLAAGEVDGLPYYTMPHVEGESLRARLTGGGELPMRDAVRLLHDVADALAYAHDQRVVHRDIKPENVLLSGKHALVTDFGVAKALVASTGDGGSLGPTPLGLAIGTPAYMAPEQAAGDPSVDQRADIYAFGVLAYEILAGQPPFGSRSAQALIAAHVAERPAPVETRRPAVPPALAALVGRCLEKNPADRPQDAGELLELLESVATGVPSSVTTPAAPAGARAPAGLGRVALLYAVAFAATILAAWAARDLLGLPDWVVPGAAVVMLLGIPVLVATAIVQRMIHPAGRPSGGASAESPRRPSVGIRLATAARPWLTWRRAALGGAAAVAAFALLVVAYLGARALGVGPAGSLLAAGKMKERERLLVVDFASPPSDTLLGTVLSEALRTDLTQSTVVRPVPASLVRDVLQRMERPPASRVDFALGREVASREGIAVLLDGDVSPVGSGYVVSARLVSTQSGEALAAFRETAADSRDLLPALDRLSRALRAKAGESLRAVRRSPPLERVTTSSLEALRRYTQGVRAIEIEGDFTKGYSLLEEAIALDTSFAMAYRKLGIDMGNRDEPPDRVYALLRKAYDHRDRLTDAERYLTIGSFHTAAEYDPELALTAYTKLVDLAPDNSAAQNNLGEVYRDLRDPVRAESSYARGAAVEAGVLSALNLAATQFELGKFDAAKATIRATAEKYPLSRGPLVYSALVAASSGNFDSAAATIGALREARRSSPRIVANFSFRLAALSAARGRIAESDRFHRDAAEANRQRPNPGGTLVNLALVGWNDAWYRGQRERGVATMERALTDIPLSSLAPLARPYGVLAWRFALVGRPDRAKSLLAEWERAVPLQQRRQLEPLRHTTLGEIAFAERRYAEALEEFRAGDEGRCIVCALPHLGRAFDALGQGDSAIAAYERYVQTREFERLPTDAVFLAGVHKRLGELYEVRGDTARATDHYGRFVDLWKRADAELQPQVVEVRRRMDALFRGRR